MVSKNSRILWMVLTREDDLDYKHISVKPLPKQLTSMASKNNWGRMPKPAEFFQSDSAVYSKG